MGLTVATAVVGILGRSGVHRAYTVPGEPLLTLLDGLAAEPTVQVITTRHEASAAYMADAIGKLHEVPALAMACGGSGAAKLAAGVHTAYVDETPMLVLLGYSGSAGSESHAPAVSSMFEPITKFAARARDAAEVPGLVATALHTACSGRRGPAVVCVPSEFWQAPFDFALPSTEGAPPAAEPERLAREIAALAESARYPVAIVGREARGASDELRALAEEFGFGVYNAFRCQDGFPEEHPNYLGHLSPDIPTAQLDALERADLVLALGTTSDEVPTENQRYPNNTGALVVVAPEPAPPRRGGLTFLVDSPVAAFLAHFRRAATKHARSWAVDHAATREGMTPPDAGQSDRVHPADVVRAVRGLAPRDTVVAEDAGYLTDFVHRYWCFNTPHSQLSAGDGAMGYAVPAAVAAKIAEPDRTVVAVVGDEGALMAGHEIETAVRYRAPIVMLVLQNGMYGTIAMHQAKVHRRLSSVSIGLVDFASWARGLGAAGFTVEAAEELEPALEAALGRQRPCVVDIRTDPDVLGPHSRLSNLLEPGWPA